MIGIVDYGMGNLRSVFNAFNYLGAEVLICRKPVDLKRVKKIVIPGVGAFKDCIFKLKQASFVDELNHGILFLKKPVLGICLGMQIMAKFSQEGGYYEGLGWIDAEVIKLNPGGEKKRKVPNIGWNEISYNQENQLFNGIGINPDVYFVHSYYMKCNNVTDIAATYEYGHSVTAAILNGNIFATQFHPEKSQDIGLKILSNFINWNP